MVGADSSSTRCNEIVLPSSTLFLPASGADTMSKPRGLAFSTIDTIVVLSVAAVAGLCVLGLMPVHVIESFVLVTAEVSLPLPRLRFGVC